MVEELLHCVHPLIEEGIIEQRRPRVSIDRRTNASTTDSPARSACAARDVAGSAE